MVKANELRIGNYVQHEPYKDEKWKVDLKLLEVIHDQLVYVVGIPLTPEILVKAGFKKSDDNYGGFLISISEDEEIRIKHNGFTFVWPMFGNSEVVVTYLHQLQNFIFIITGKELEITL